jgi:hypothetical protein
VQHYSLPAVLAADYVPGADETQAVFQVVQNKLHFAVTGQTTPELIASRADAGKPNMGMTTWKSGVVRKGDVMVAKNYLKAEEIVELNRIVIMFLDFAEDQARRRTQVFLNDWKTRLDDFLRFNERAVCRTGAASAGATPTARRPMNTTDSRPAVEPRWKRKGRRMRCGNWKASRTCYRNDRRMVPGNRKTWMAGRSPP